MFALQFYTILLFLPSISVSQSISITPLSHDGTKCPPSADILTTYLNTSSPTHLTLTHSLPSFQPPIGPEIPPSTRSTCTTTLLLTTPPTHRIWANPTGMSIRGLALLGPNESLTFRAFYNWTETGSTQRVSNYMELRGPSKVNGRFEKSFWSGDEVWKVASRCGGGVLRVEYFSRSGGVVDRDGLEGGGEEGWEFENSLGVEEC